MSVELTMRRTLSGLAPIDRIGEEALTEYAIGEELKVRARKGRHTVFSRKWFALLKVVYPHQDAWPTFDLFRRAVQRACGYFEEVNGQTFDVSISFVKMDQKEFEDLFERTLVLIETRIIPGIDRAEVEREYREVLAGYKGYPEPRE